jgi:hypothetical protein
MGSIPVSPAAKREIVLKGQFLEVKKKLSTILEKYHVLVQFVKQVFQVHIARN